MESNLSKCILKIKIKDEHDFLSVELHLIRRLSAIHEKINSKSFKQKQSIIGSHAGKSGGGADFKPSCIQGLRL